MPSAFEGGASTLSEKGDKMCIRDSTPSEAFNETVEELTQSLMPLFAKNGMDWMLSLIHILFVR